ncbi:uncharacterized protein ASPGLDRAFT_57702 [Aspergillus glaucus CBS 516.65]|uniref:Uncharacterized protein n=1 Tax=Aspergillus glaucus CBS 516.65 TaxID=1160497 RepID=A0A1L9VLH7_ASPGL|nr:hypothetical protein ASPGLDRAFT_57702 [Aspergillus glaucus CBS 516.65]OJJ84755.1 hypothetical protein ASPGLDRAFT_57702 [Aspergillus glaucus CBS 516.65]
MKWEEFEKAGFLPFIEKHEREGTSWETRVIAWKKEFGTSRSIGSLRGQLNRCILEGSYTAAKTAGFRSSSTNADTRARAKPVKRLQSEMPRPSQRSPQTKRIPLHRHSVWNVSPNREASPARSSAPTLEGSLSLPSMSFERPALKNYGKEPNVPPPEEVTERLKYCAAFLIIEVCFLKEELQDIKTFLFHSLGKYKAIHFPSFLNHFDYDLYKTFRQYVGIIPWAKVFKKAESTERGQRLWPTGSQDKKLNFRIDKGAKISDTQHEIIIQANKGADDPEVKKSAQKDSHRILAKCTINLKKGDGEQAKSDLEASFRDIED